MNAHKKSGALLYTSLSKVFGVTQANKIIQKAHAITGHFTYYPSLPCKSPNF